jgi:hypothetical protein
MESRGILDGIYGILDRRDMRKHGGRQRKWTGKPRDTSVLFMFFM